eukprot:8779266-Alexandrium_andersonii.AAC.1
MSEAQDRRRATYPPGLCAGETASAQPAPTGQRQMKSIASNSLQQFAAVSCVASVGGGLPPPRLRCAPEALVFGGRGPGQGR